VVEKGANTANEAYLSTMGAVLPDVSPALGYYATAARAQLVPVAEQVEQAWGGLSAQAKAAIASAPGTIAALGSQASALGAQATTALSALGSGLMNMSAPMPLVVPIMDCSTMDPMTVETFSSAGLCTPGTESGQMIS
jgi:hypothetical protein